MGGGEREVSRGGRQHSTRLYTPVRLPRRWPSSAACATRECAPRPSASNETPSASSRGATARGARRRGRRTPKGPPNASGTRPRALAHPARSPQTATGASNRASRCTLIAKHLLRRGFRGLPTSGDSLDLLQGRTRSRSLSTRMPRKTGASHSLSDRRSLD